MTRRKPLVIIPIVFVGAVTLGCGGADLEVGLSGCEALEVGQTLELVATLEGAAEVDWMVLAYPGEPGNADLVVAEGEGSAAFTATEAGRVMVKVCGYGEDGEARFDMCVIDIAPSSAPGLVPGEP